MKLRKLLMLFLIALSGLVTAQNLTHEVKICQFSKDGETWYDASDTPIIKSITYKSGGNLGYVWINGEYHELKPTQYTLKQRPNDVIEITFSPTGDTNSEFTLSDKSGEVVGAGYIKNGGKSFLYKLVFN